MTMSNPDFLSRLLAVDAALSLVAGFAFAAGATILAPFLGLPMSLLFWAGLFLLPWGAFLGVLARRRQPARLAVMDVVIVNLLWVAASVGVLMGGLVQPNLLGTAFVLVQAAAVAGLTVLQVMGLRRTAALAA